MSVEVLKQIWPEWSVGKRIGGGAYGTVYEASRNEYGVENHAAIKIISVPQSEAEVDTLLSEGLDMQATKTHFQTIVNDYVNEIKLMVDLEGRSNIVNVKDYKVVEKKDEFGWFIFILMELLTPFAVHTCDHQMSETEVIKLGVDICTALETCAEEDIIHRDIKPGNILVHKSGTFKLGDFGIARKLENRTGGLSQRCTPRYMAPEVATSAHYDKRVDIYSLGIVLYELLNGRRIPFQPNKQINSPTDIKNAILRRNSGEKLPVPCDASPAMADLILRACAHDPNMRFASATEMKQALMNVANGTYQIGMSNLENTHAGRKASSVNDLDGTRKVRQAPAATNQKSAPVVNTFGSVPKKKSKMPVVIAAVLAVVLFAGAGIFAVPKLFDGNDITEPNETANYSKFDEEQITSVISEAEVLAAEEDYEGALVKVQTALVTYPKSAGLQDKADEYTEELNAQLKAKTLDEAKTLADSGDYVSAIALIKKAQETQGDDADYQAALNSYSIAYKSEVIASADALAANGDYIGALEAVGTASAVIGDDAELSAKSTEYENNYVDGIVEQADGLLLTGDFDSAETLVNEAKKHFPNNEQLVAESEKIKNARPIYLLSEVDPYMTPHNYNDDGILNMGGQNYTHGFSCLGYGDYPTGNKTYFNLDGKYALISFTAGIVNDAGEKVGFTFYADGELVYGFTMESGDLPTEHIFSVEGCKQLVIGVYDGYSTAMYSGRYGLADIKVTKNLSASQSSVTNTLQEGELYLLKAIEPYKSPYNYNADGMINMGGHTYSNGFTCMGYGDDPVGNETYFNLGGKYSKLSFIAGIVEDRERTVNITIYADGSPIYTFEMESGALPTNHTVDIAGCKQLVFSVYDDRGVANGSGTYGFANIIVS